MIAEIDNNLAGDFSVSTVKHEFVCTECQKHFDITLNMALNGNYRIHCPNCGHVHYRTVKNGQITDTRFPDNHESILVEDIRPMKASCRDHPKEKVPEVERGFLSNLWAEIFSARA